MAKLSTFKRRRLSNFILCILLAFLAWLFIALTNTIVYTRKTVIEYKNLPANKAFYPLQSDSVTIQLEAKGWRSLISLFKEKTKPLPVNLGLLNKEDHIIFSKNLSSFSRNYIKGQNIVSVKPDTIYFDFAKRAIKKIPVKVESELNFKKQYGLSSNLIIKPALVTLVGPERDITKINYWKTDVVKASRVSSSFNKSISLQKVNNANFNVYPRMVNVRYQVEEFTEKEIFVPISVKNNDKFLKVNCLPDKVRITVYTPLSKFQDINIDNIKATVDLNLWVNYKVNKLPVSVINNLSYVKVIKVEPQLIDFIIKE